MKKFIKSTVFLLALLICTIIPSAAYASSTPGSAADPLVAKSWVDNYVEQQFAPLEEQIAQIKEQLEQPTAVSIQLYIGQSTATVNGEKVSIDPERPAVVPQLKSDAAAGGYTMVPVRFIAECLGVDVEWLPDSRQVVFSDGSEKVTLTVSSTTADINGSSYTMGYAPYIENQRTFVHIRFIAEAFDCQVSWDQATKRVDIER